MLNPNKSSASPWVVVANELDRNIVVIEFVLQSCYYTTPSDLYSPERYGAFSPQAIGYITPLRFFSQDGTVLNNWRQVICHWTKKLK